MKDKIKTGQLGLLLMLIMPGGKYLSLPASMANGAGRDFWLSMAMMFILDFVCLLFLLWGIKLNTEGKSIRDILESAISKIGAKIVFFLLGLFYLLRLSILLTSTLGLLSTTFTIKTNWIAYILPLSGVMIFIVNQGLTNIARISELIFVLVFLALGSILIFSIRRADFGNLLPILDNGVLPIIRTGFRNSIWFSDSLFILFAMENFRPNKKLFGSVTIAFWVGAVVSVFMSVLLIAFFGTLSGLTEQAMSKVSQFSISLTTNGRLDWLSMSIWMVSVFLKASLHVYCCNKCVRYIFGLGESKPHFWTFAVVLLPIIIVPLLLPITEFASKVIAEQWWCTIFWPIQYILPFLIPLFVALYNKKENKKRLYPSLEVMTCDH